ncbi:endonuclease/exonuclease/phosphatase family metal-dependent hydrolase [Ereboglobus sp. PH5-10]|uniref:endonuclease/exonuclease/phosphatase family protein n=1 Tax=Ereboglobus sp. PH5-10 TaxID=2940629 RepID=UPI0024072DB5|nr:endonuclease/exonuclease/phosphatase family protein [Ereboglobus sp. PH5-10]MDF9827153.1 endonuclease/exonuclease/phosphatase family metal-dependent hydrolase [Ereboglobus sp. PH5-10]
MKKLPPSRILAFFLCALAANLAFAANTSDSDIPQRKRQSPEVVRVLSANIRFPLAADNGTGNEWQLRKELARDVLLAQDADIICFQEFRKQHHEFLKDYFPGHDHAGFVDGPDERKANMVFYSKKRFEKIAIDGVFLSPTPDVYRSKFEESASVRNVTRLHLRDRKTGRELMIWNTHFDHKYQAGRDKQAAALVEQIKKHPADIPQIITGDFNCPAKTQAIKTIKAGGFIDTYTALHGSADPGYTYHNFKGHNYGKTHGKIDFVFCNDALRPTVTEIIRDNRTVDGVRRYPSDHYFISAEFEYAKTKK